MPDHPYAGVPFWCGYCSTECSGNEVVEEEVTEAWLHEDCGKRVEPIEPPGGSEYIPTGG